MQLGLFGLPGGASHFPRAEPRRWDLAFDQTIDCLRANNGGEGIPREGGREEARFAMFVNKSEENRALLSLTPLFLSFTVAESSPSTAAVQTMLYSAGTNTSIGCPEVRTAMDALNAHTLEWFCRGCEDEGREPLPDCHLLQFNTSPTLDAICGIGRISMIQLILFALVPSWQAE